MKKITLYNNYHNTEVKLIPNNGRLTHSQMERSRRVLCGCSGCACGDDFGARGPQESIITMDSDRGFFDRTSFVATISKIEI